MYYNFYSCNVCIILCYIGNLQCTVHDMKTESELFGITMIIGTVSANIAPRSKCYKNASRLNRYNFPTDNAIDFLISKLHSEMV